MKSFSQSIFSKFWLSDELGQEQNLVNFERRGHAEYKQLTLCKLVALLQILNYSLNKGKVHLKGKKKQHLGDNFRNFSESFS